MFRPAPFAMTFLAVATLAAAASAAPCGTWRAAMEEDEGGLRMIASVCSGIGDPAISLSIACQGKTFYMEYAPDPSVELPPGGGVEYQTTFIFSDGVSRYEAVLQFQALNAVMAFSWNRSAALTAMLKGAGPLRMEDASGKLKPAVFPLKGARAALERLERTCGK